ncbi:hypothetical protein ACJ41O_015037 [Fusarium nematophilum]
MLKMPPSITVLHEVPDIVPEVHEGAGIYRDLVGSDQAAIDGMVAGVWDALDLAEPTPAIISDREEFKYIIRGEALVKNESTGETHQLKPGSLLWIPTGAKLSLVSSQNCKAIYVERRLEIGVNGCQTDGGWAMALQGHLDALVTDFITQNPGSQAAVEKARKGIPGGTTRSVLESDPFPLVVKSGKAATLTSVDGKTYTDFQSDFTAGLFGHSHPDLQEAITKTAHSGFSLGATTEFEGQLSEHLKERFSSIDQVRFCNSGTEANMYAVAAALAYTGRTKVLVFDHAYHGGTLSFGDKPNLLNAPHDFVVGTYNDVSKTRAVLSGQIGVIIAEPMQSAGGMRAASKGFLEFLRESANVLGAVLIFDEVVTSRLDYHGIQGATGVFPDMTTLGKYIGGGLPFGAFGGKAAIMAQFDMKSDAAKKLSHSGTFNNNIFTMSAAVAASRLTTKEAIERINAFGDKARQGIATAVAASKKSVRIVPLGVGSCVGIHFADPVGDTLRSLLFFHLLSRGLLIGRRGFLALNFAHSEEDIDAFLLAFEEFLQLYA